jgi:hypothetical protein
VRNWILAAGALLAAGAAQAQADSGHYATVGAWEIAVEPARNLCKMYRYFGSSVDQHTEGLVIRHDSVNDNAGLTWSTDGSTPFPMDGQIALFLDFVKGKSSNGSWGSRSFQHGKPGDTRYFATVFTGARDSQRFLRDVAGNGLIGLSLGPTLLTALSLDAAAATATLGECSAKLAGRPSAN